MADEKNSYREVMDRTHAPDSLVEKTLGAMNAEVNKRHKARKARLSAFQRIAVFAAAAAACIVLFFGVRQTLLPREEEISFSEIRTASLLQISWSVRGEAAQIPKEQVETLFGIKSEGFVPGFVYKNAVVAQLRTPTTMLSSLKTEYVRGDAQTLYIEFTDYETPLYSAMVDFKPVEYKGADVRFAEDGDTGVLYAVWEKQGVYYTLSSADLSKTDFGKLVKKIVTG